MHKIRIQEICVLLVYNGDVEEAIQPSLKNHVRCLILDKRQMWYLFTSHVIIETFSC